MLRYIYLFVVCFFISDSIFSQALTAIYPRTSQSAFTSPWSAACGLESYDYPASIIQTHGNNGGYVMTGVTWGKTYPPTGGDLWIVSFDSSGGNISNQMAYDNSFDYYTNIYAARDEAHSIANTSDGGWIIAGDTEKYDLNYYLCSTEIWVIRFTPDGKILWEKAYGKDYDSKHINDDWGASICQTSDGGFIVAGTTTSYDDETVADVWVLKLDSVGNIIWQKRYGGSENDVAIEVVENYGGNCGYSVLAYSRSFEGLWLLNLYPDGTINWQKVFKDLGWGEVGFEIHNPCSMTSVSDGGWVLTSPIQNSYSDYWVARLDPSGAVIWQKTYGGDDFDLPFSIKQCHGSNGGFIVAGQERSFQSHFNIWILLLNPDGGIQWEKSYGRPNQLEYAKCIINNSEGGWAVVSRADNVMTTGYSGSESDYMMMKLNPDGNMAFRPVPGFEVFDTNCATADANVLLENTTVTDLDTDATVKIMNPSSWLTDSSYLKLSK